MPKRSRKVQKKTPPRDENQAAFDLVKQIEALAGDPATEGKDPLAVLLGRRGGLKGGRARADKMTAKERKKSAAKAAEARWKPK